MRFVLKTAADTEALGAALWRCLPEKSLVFLYGDLGSGKTTLMRGLLQAGGCQCGVRSPTYSLVEEYRLSGRLVFHFDLYRLQDPQELEWMGMTDYLNAHALCCIEWPQMGAGFLPPADAEIHLQYQEHSRVVDIGFVEPVLESKLLTNWKNRDLLL